MAGKNKLGSKVAKSIITLASRTLVLNILNFAGAFFLTIFLSPSDFGVFIVTSSVIDILTYFSDIGLAGALIQKKEALGKDEINATFTIQMGLVSTAIIVASFFSGLFAKTYKLPTEGIYLYFALLLAFFFSSLKTIPTVISERRFKFGRVAISQVVETFVYNIVIIILAWRGLGIRSYIWAVIARAISGTIVIYVLVKWIPKISFNFKAVKKLLAFGVPYQINGLIAVFKDRVSLLILGGIIGTQGLGILGWAEKWANLPLRYFMDPMIKIAFPLFARVQSDISKAKQALEKTIYFVVNLTFPTLAGGFIIMPYIIQIIPKYEKWDIAIPAFNLFLVSATIAAISTFLTNFLTAIGQIKKVMALMIMWTVLTLSFYPLMASLYGYNGVAVASVLIGTSSMITYFLTKRVVKDLNLVKQIIPSLLSTLIMILGTKYLNNFIAKDFSGLIKIVVSGISLYLASIILIDGRNLINQSKVFINNLKKN